MKLETMASELQPTKSKRVKFTANQVKRKGKYLWIRVSTTEMNGKTPMRANQSSNALHFNKTVNGKTHCDNNSDEASNFSMNFDGNDEDDDDDDDIDDNANSNSNNDDDDVNVDVEGDGDGEAGHHQEENCENGDDGQVANLAGSCQNNSENDGRNGHIGMLHLNDNVRRQIKLSKRDKQEIYEKCLKKIEAMNEDSSRQISESIDKLGETLSLSIERAFSKLADALLLQNRTNWAASLFNQQQHQQSQPQQQQSQFNSNINSTNNFDTSDTDLVLPNLDTPILHLNNNSANTNVNSGSASLNHNTNSQSMNQDEMMTNAFADTLDLTRFQPSLNVHNQTSARASFMNTSTNSYANNTSLPALRNFNDHETTMYNFKKLLDIKRKSNGSDTVLATNLLLHFFKKHELLEEGVNVEGNSAKGSSLECRALSPTRVQFIKKFCIENSESNMSGEDVWKRCRNSINKKMSVLRKRNDIFKTTTMTASPPVASNRMSASSLQINQNRF